MHLKGFILIAMSLVIVAADTLVAAEKANSITTERPYPVSWASCDFSSLPTGASRSSCYDCTSTVRCTRMGAIVVGCRRRSPYCVEGRCRSEPSEECADDAVRSMLEEEELLEYRVRE